MASQEPRCGPRGPLAPAPGDCSPLFAPTGMKTIPLGITHCVNRGDITPRRCRTHQRGIAGAATRGPPATGLRYDSVVSTERVSHPAHENVSIVPHSPVMAPSVGGVFKKHHPAVGQWGCNTTACMEPRGIHTDIAQVVQQPPSDGARDGKEATGALPSLLSRLRSGCVRSRG